MIKRFKNLLNFWRRKEFFKNRTTILLMIVVFVLNLVGWGIIYIKIKPSDIPFTLHYSVYQGIDLLGPWHKLYTLPGLGLIIGLVNISLSYLIYSEERTASYLLLAGAILFQTLILVGVVALILVNI